MILNTNRVKVKKKQEVIFSIRVEEMEGESRRLFKTFLSQIIKNKDGLNNLTATGRTLQRSNFKQNATNVRRY